MDLLLSMSVEIPWLKQLGRLKKKKTTNNYIMLSLSKEERDSIRARPKKVIRLPTLVGMNWNRRNETLVRKWEKSFAVLSPTLVRTKAHFWWYSLFSARAATLLSQVSRLLSNSRVITIPTAFHVLSQKLGYIESRMLTGLPNLEKKMRKQRSFYYVQRRS